METRGMKAPSRGSPTGTENEDESTWHGFFPNTSIHPSPSGEQPGAQLPEPRGLCPAPGGRGFLLSRQAGVALHDPMPPPEPSDKTSFSR